MNSFFKQQGGKAYLAGKIIPLLPVHLCYVEPFCGAANVLFRKPRSQVEVLNDTDGDIMNAFRCVRLHHDAILQELHLLLNSRAHFHAWRKTPDANLTDVQRAARFIYCKQLSFGADGDSFGVVRTNGAGANTNLGLVAQKITAAHERLQGVIIEHKDWRDCLRVYDRSTTLFYCDPPYIRGRQRAYASWTEKDLAELVGVLRGLAGKFVLSFNDSAATRKHLRGFRLKRFTRARGIKAGSRYAELLAMNF